MSINEDTKLKKGKEKGKIGSVVGLYKYLIRATKALVVSELIATWQNIVEVLVRFFYYITIGLLSSTKCCNTLQLLLKLYSTWFSGF